MMKYKIKVLTIDNIVLSFTVSQYHRQGDSIEFIDEKTNLFKSFPAARTQIQEVEE